MDLEKFLSRAERLLDRLEQLLPPPVSAPDWEAAPAFRWLSSRRGFLAVPHPHPIRLEDLRGVDEAKQQLARNTRQFLRGLPANNALLWGAKGTGKSSLIKALLNAHAGEGLRLLEVEKTGLGDLPEIVEYLRPARQRFILFCDDLSFEQDDASYKALKSLLDGSISAPPDNVLLYATSNRRHLLPEYRRENLETCNIEGEIHHGEAVEEKISLSERFGLWLSFYPFDQATYLQIVDYWLGYYRAAGTQQDAATRQAALQWALVRGSRSGRAAWQFARDWAGRRGLGE